MHAVNAGVAFSAVRGMFIKCSQVVPVPACGSKPFFSPGYSLFPAKMVISATFGESHFNLKVELLTITRKRKNWMALPLAKFNWAKKNLRASFFETDWSDHLGRATTCVKWPLFFGTARFQFKLSFVERPPVQCDHRPLTLGRRASYNNRFTCTDPLIRCHLHTAHVVQWNYNPICTHMS